MIKKILMSFLLFSSAYADSRIEETLGLAKSLQQEINTNKTQNIHGLVIYSDTAVYIHEKQSGHPSYTYFNGPDIANIEEKLTSENVPVLKLRESSQDSSKNFTCFGKTAASNAQQSNRGQPCKGSEKAYQQLKDKVNAKTSGATPTSSH